VRSGNDGEKLLELVAESSNVEVALRRVKKNKGSPGIDGMTVDELPAHVAKHWKQIREDLLTGRYQPEPVRRHAIPKKDGGVRELGIPTVLDRLIQQCILQVLQPRLDPSFSQHSYGFRPGKTAHDAVRAAQRFIQEGRRWVVDVDLEAFFDRVNHDVLMSRLATRITDRRLLRLIRHVRSKRAGERLMESLRRLYAGLRLRVNESKSAVARPQDRKFLGYSFWYAKGSVVKRRVASKALAAMKDRVRDISKRSGGRSISSVITELRGYLVGWKNFFQLADTPNVFRELDEWIRHRVRAIHLKQWKRGATILRELVKRGMRPDGPTGARRIAFNGRRWWKNSGKAINIAFPIAYFDGLGLPRLAATSTR
jgi:retron-type reverse transcriptase